MLDPHTPALILAPMEGVTDAPMRAVQGECGAFTHSVSEFLRVNQNVPPKSVFLKHVPELLHSSLTPNGLPVHVQLLGGDATLLAETAAFACELGARAIDLNFGCPAKTVNRHDGGATLLKYPKRIREIVGAVRAAVPRAIPVSAKLRLGWDSLDPIFENAAMAAEGGASWLTIHARTRMAGYAPPVYWPSIGQVRERLGIPVIANGDIWSLERFRQCRDETGCTHFMLGRGAVANPLLAQQVAIELGLIPTQTPQSFDWPTQLERLIRWTQHYQGVDAGRMIRRLKQWLNMAASFGTFTGFGAVKRATTTEEMFATLRANVGVDLASSA